MVGKREIDREDLKGDPVHCVVDSMPLDLEDILPKAVWHL